MKQEGKRAGVVLRKYDLRLRVSVMVPAGTPPFNSK